MFELFKMEGIAWSAIVTLVRKMRDHGRVDIIGLTKTDLMNSDLEELMFTALHQ
jgi:hypothetical protein